MPTDLKSCPFCGKEGLHDRLPRYSGDKIGIEVWGCDECQVWVESKEIWNIRVTIKSDAT